jgi:hypothetical protein
MTIPTTDLNNSQQTASLPSEKGMLPALNNMDVKLSIAARM